MNLPPTWIALAGPTACGKTALALELAKAWPIEIVSVDSALVFRGMDIGTAKPSTDEQAQAPHHLIDILDPSQAYSAAEFVRSVHRLLPEIWARGRIPVLVGGTMLYFKALFDGLDEMPAAQADWRLRLETRAATEGWPSLHAELAKVDPVTAARLSAQDGQRIGRALEVWHSTGRPLSSFHSRRPDPARPWDILGVQGRLWSLEPNERAWLHQRIEQRFATMLDGGFLHEVTRLRQRGDLDLSLPAVRCVGYRQAWEICDANGVEDATRLERAAQAELGQRGVFATRQLAKRQLTWLRSMPQRQTVACDAPQATATAMASIGQWLKGR